jgi:hypothetical protein
MRVAIAKCTPDYNKLAEGVSLKYRMELLSTVRMNVFPTLILHCLEQNKLHYSLNVYDMLVLRFSNFVWVLYGSGPITVASRSEAWTVFARSNTGVVRSNPNRDMDVCVRYCSGLATGWSPVQGVLSTVYRITTLKSDHGPAKGCRAIDEWMNYMGCFVKSSIIKLICESAHIFL